MLLLLLLQLHVPIGSGWQAPTFKDLELRSDRSWPTGMLIILQTVSPL
jgi:hypothetical protein